MEKLAPLKSLTTVYLEHNPIAKDIRYRARVKILLPWIQQIDAIISR